MAHKYAWISFCVYLIGLGFIIASVAVDSFYKLSYENYISYIGSFAFTSPQCVLTRYDNAQVSCSMKIESNCKLGNVVPMTERCREFNTMRAFHVMSLIFGGSGLFAHILTLVTTPTAMRRLLSLLVGGGTTACLIICMVTAVSFKGDIAFTARMEYHASFALVIVAWIFTGISTITLFLFNGSKYTQAKSSSEGIEFN